ncbi:MAG: NAD+ synthase [Chloroflexota bacterium]|nr:NAD+ synthase [Chloroflexota bacterium]
MATGVTEEVAEGAPFAVPAEVEIDVDVARRIIAEFIRGQLRQAGFERALVGLSGGIDSALVAYLVAEAIGAERLLCVLMPYRTSSPASRADAEEVVGRLGCASELVDISPMVDAYFGGQEDGARGPATGVDRSAEGAAAADTMNLRRGNFMARMRMAVLYDRSVPWGGLVVGTGNKTETLLGYTTIYGDSASAFNPIGDLYKTQVRLMARAAGVPEQIIRKAPSADLWPGQTDESEVGFSYAEVDRLLYWLVDKRRSPDALVASGWFDPTFVRRVERMVAASEFKRQVPPIAKIGPRTAGIDYLYPRRRPGSARR